MNAARGEAPGEGRRPTRPTRRGVNPSAFTPEDELGPAEGVERAWDNTAVVGVTEDGRVGVEKAGGGITLETGLENRFGFSGDPTYNELDATFDAGFVRRGDLKALGLA